MRALIIIAACLGLAVVLKAIEALSSRKAIRSVGAKSNAKSKDIATIDLNDPESIKEGLAHYKDLVD